MGALRGLKRADAKGLLLKWMCTYDLVDLGDLGLKNGDGIANGGLLVRSAGDGGSSEAHGGHGGELVLLGSAGCKLRKHPLIIIILN